MKILKRLIKLHRFLFGMAVLCTFLSVILNLCWNEFLAVTLDKFANSASSANSTILVSGLFIILFLTISEYLSSYCTAFTCETFAHEMRLGYAGYYLQSDIQMLSKLNVGEEQSAMQNEFNDISNYLYENLFALMKQFGSFVVTVVFLLCQNFKLALVSTLPVIPLVIYCSLSSKVIKNYTEQCQYSRQKINGLADIILELFPIIKVYSANKMVDDTMNERLLTWGNVNIKKERVSAKLMSLSGVLSFVPLLLLLGFGGFMVINGEISLGTFYIFINLSGNVSGFLQNMPNIYARFRSFRASIGRLEGKLVLKKV